MRRHRKGIYANAKKVVLLSSTCARFHFRAQKALASTRDTRAFGLFFVPLLRFTLNYPATKNETSPSLVGLVSRESASYDSCSLPPIERSFESGTKKFS